MAKRKTSGKSTAHQQKTRRRQSSDKRASRQEAAADRHYDRGQGPTRPEEENVNQGIPEEHYYGERRSRTPGMPLDSAGSLDEETLSQEAPYNRTYGGQGVEREPK